jgi:hypothetical protein
MELWKCLRLKSEWLKHCGQLASAMSEIFASILYQFNKVTERIADVESKILYLF